MQEKTASRIHWSFWLLSAVALIFNLMGCANFLMQMNADLVDAMPEVYRSMIETRPAWATAAFAAAVFGGALGCLLLLFRKAIAYYVLIVSLLGAVIVQFPLLGMTGLPVEALIGSLSQFVVTAFLIWYAKRAQHKGWIR